MFFGRKKVFDQIEKKAWMSCAIIGPRRIGKTSLLYELRKRFAKYPGQTYVHISCQGILNYKDFENELLSTLIGSGRYVYNNQEKSLSQIIVGSARQLGNRYVIALDEVDEIISSNDPEFIKIRELFSNPLLHGRFRFIVTGYSSLWNNLSDSTSPYYNLFNRLQLGPFSENESIDFIRTTLSDLDNNVGFSKTAIKEIVRLSGCIPWLLQAMCSEILSASSINPHEEPDELVIRAAKSSLVQHEIFECTTMNCSDLGNLILSYFAENVGHDEKLLLGNLYSQSINLPIQKLFKELNILIMSGAIFKKSNGYYFTSEILRKYLLSFWTYRDQLHFFKKNKMDFDTKMLNNKKNYDSKVYNITNIGRDAVHSQFQSGNKQSDISMYEKKEDTETLMNLISQVKNSLEEFNLNNHKYSEILADIQCVEAQIKSAHPKKLIIQESLVSIRSILEGITGSIIASGLIDQLKMFM